MPVGEICNREVVFAARTTTIVEAAQLMRRYHVGDLVVADEVEGRRVPVGMVTDRDLVVEVLAREQPFAACTVDAVMSAGVVCVPETAGLIETIQLMRSHGVRRLPVVDANGALIGILAAAQLVASGRRRIAVGGPQRSPQRQVDERRDGVALGLALDRIGAWQRRLLAGSPMLAAQQRELATLRALALRHDSPLAGSSLQQLRALRGR